MSEQLVPEIRVAGFDGPWLGKRLQDLVDVIGGGTPSTTVPAFWGGEIDWYSPSEIGASSTTPPSRQKITQLGLVSSSAKALPGGRTVLFTSRASIGHAAILDHDATTNQGFQSLVTKQDTDVQFLYAMTSKIAEYARSQATGSTFLEVSSKALREMDVVVPSAREQRAIGSVLRRFTCAIEEHQKKHRHLKQAKASLMQRMFPAPGANEPEIRFEGFTGAWAERKLTDEVGFFGGLTYSPRDVVPAPGVLVLRSSNVDGSSIVLDDCVYVHPGAVNVENVRPGDIVVVVRNGSRALIGKHAIVKRWMPSTVIGAFMTGIRCDRPEFVSALLSTSLFDAEVSKSMGATINQITGSMFAKMSFLFPEAEEQQAIGAFFSKLDDLIEAQAQYVSKLQQVKSALLQKMFI